MSEPFLAEVKLFSFNFAPKGWALCNGQLLPINQNQALFALLGTIYGGDGRTTFALPNLQGRTPIHMGQGHTEGEAGGEESHTLNIAELPSHSHTAQATTTTPASATQLNSLLTVTGGGRRPLTPYGDPVGLTPLHSGSMANAGGGQPHSNMQPYLVLNFCIALQGIFPTRN